MRQRRIDFWLGVGTLALVAASAGVVAWQPFARRDPVVAGSSPFVLAPVNQEGKLRIDWDPKSGPVKTAQGATLIVNDGGTVETYPVASSALRHGGLDYVRKTGDIVLSLKLDSPGATPDTEAFTRIVSSVPQPQVAKQTKRPVVQTRARRRR